MPALSRHTKLVKEYAGFRNPVGTKEGLIRHVRITKWSRDRGKVVSTLRRIQRHEPIQAPLRKYSIAERNPQ